MRLNRRFFTLFAVLMLCMSFLTITASAEANPPKDDVIIYTADPTEPKPTEAAPKPTTPKPTTPPKTEPPATTAPTTPTAVKPVEPFTEGNAEFESYQRPYFSVSLSAARESSPRIRSTFALAVCRDRISSLAFW